MLEVPALIWQLPALFERLLDEREHIAVVLDEYGGTAGILTLEDVLESISDSASDLVDKAADLVKGK